jgi:hypothetical protein
MTIDLDFTKPAAMPAFNRADLILMQFALSAGAANDEHLASLKDTDEELERDMLQRRAERQRDLARRINRMLGSNT